MTYIDFIIIITGWGLGNLFLNNFEKHLTWQRRLRKIAFLVAILYLAGLIGRIWMYGLLAIMALGILYLHGYWFPKNGVNGITAEPYDKYLELIEKMKGKKAKKGD